MDLRLSRASNSEVNSLILQKIEHIWEFMAALVTCKFDEDPIKIEGTIDRTRSNMGFFATQGQVTPKWINWSGRNSTHPRFYGCPAYLQDWWRSDQKWSSYCPDNIFSIISLWEIFSSLKGKSLQSEYSDLTRNRTCSRFYGFPYYLQVRRRSDQNYTRYRSDNIFKIPICRKSMNSVDIVHGHCLAGVLEWRSMDTVHSVHGHCPLNPLTMSTQSTDNVHGDHWQCPLSRWTFSMGYTYTLFSIDL